MKPSRRAVMVLGLVPALGACQKAAVHEIQRPADPHHCLRIFSRLSGSPVLNVAGQSIEWISDTHLRVQGVVGIGENTLSMASVDLTGDNFLIEEGECPAPPPKS